MLVQQTSFPASPNGFNPLIGVALRGALFTVQQKQID